AIRLVPPGHHQTEGEAALRIAATCYSYVAFPFTVKGIFWSARASNAASGTRCSPERSTRPEKRPSRKPSARFSVLRSGNQGSNSGRAKSPDPAVHQHLH